MEATINKKPKSKKKTAVDKQKSAVQPDGECSDVKNSDNAVIDDCQYEATNNSDLNTDHVENQEECTAKIDLQPKESAVVVVAMAEECVEIGQNSTKNDTYDKLLTINKSLANAIKNQQLDETFLNIDKLISVPKAEIDDISIKPYTESQLAALYTNSELEMLETFTMQYVEAELKGLAIKQHPLYELLANYLQVRERITGNTLELEQFRKEYKELQGRLWTIDRAVVNGRGECQDGTIVTASHSYQRATFHRSVFQSILRVLGLVRKLTYENHVLYSYSAEDLRLQIELYIQTAIANCANVCQLARNAPVILSLQIEPTHLKPYLTEIRLCISVLFGFQRKLIRDPQFLKETREWLGRLVGLLLRLATYQDHLFILSHILRCPAGVGQWAACFIQTPLTENPTESPFSSYQINHVLTILAAILSPIKERDRFLEDIGQSREANESLWIVVDSDGEEDDESGNSLRENDLVTLITQLPLENLFGAVLLIEKRNFENSYNCSKITQDHILRFLSFSTVLLKIFNKGLQTYNQSKYSQFSKRLSRFIRHVVQYATDQWEQFHKMKICEDKAMMKRLQVEYDSFFLRAIYYLYSSQKLGAWQFLAVVPYNLITMKTVWKIYYFLHDSDQSGTEILNPTNDEDYSRKLWDKSFRAQFEEKLASLADDESYYLLNTFANMALARKTEDMVFIQAATMDLLQIGFISQNTQELCSKSSRTLITHITSKYPVLLSKILRDIKENIAQVDSLALYLYEELPLTIWQLSDSDMELISWLLLNNPITTTESKLARMILSRLNWDNLPYEMHCDVALLIVKAADQEPNYLQWAWQMILRLRLHINDKGFQNIKQVLDPDNYDVIIKGIRQQQPLASFVAVVMTSWGHLIPLICSNGLNHLLFLQIHQKHEVVLFALYLIVPLFINCQESLINYEKFQEIIANLINADRGYISMAKSLIAVQTSVLQQFGNMIETQIANFAYYDLESPRCLVRLWINSLVSVPNWNRDTGVMYLLDVIIRASFFHSDALDVVRNAFRDLFQTCSSPEQSGITSIFKWVSSSTTMSLINSSLADYTWLAYIVIEIEFEEREKKTELWRELLVQLSKQKGKISVDSAIKKAAGALKLPSLTSSYLSIYRWAQQALDTPIDHPLLPLLWQKFFILYLSRIPQSANGDRCCVGDKFFEGIVNFTFFKKIKKRLQESLDFYHVKLKECHENNEDDVTIKEFYDNCFKVFRAFTLWLEESRLQENNLMLQSLPPQYQPSLLAFNIQGINTPWYEYVDYNRIKSEQLECIKIWKISNFRYKSNMNQPLPNAGKTMESEDPTERILRRLAVYETPKPPPQIKNTAPIVPVIDFSGKDAMFKSLDPCFKTLKQFAHNQMLKLSEYKALDCSYLELVPQLYRSVLNKVSKMVTCKGRSETGNCSGAGVVVLEMQEARINDRIDHQIQTNRNAYESLMTQSLQAAALALCTASVTIQQAIKILQAQVRCNPASSELGAELFYYILSLISDETTNYLPTKTLFALCLERLGQSHICGVEYEMPRLLEKILKEPYLGGYLAPHFSPSNVGTANLLLMYSTICKQIGSYDVTFALLSKFEIDNWLVNKTPKLSQRSDFIKFVIKALITLGYEPPIEALMLHGLYRKHLMSVFQFQFPEHYGEILVHLLKASNGSAESSLLARNVWIDVINHLARPVEINLKLPLRDQYMHYAQNQKMLQHQEILETAELFARHFTQERLQYGIYGLYPKCRHYIDIFVVLLGTNCHALTISMINTHQGLLGDKLVEKIWPYMISVFAPWVVPYSMQNLKDNMANWIQQLADDRSVLLPWIPADAEYARELINTFYECVHFLITTLPASAVTFNYIWQWYVTSFAHTAVKDYILEGIHYSFRSFPWYKFWPSISDVELMLRVIDQYLPECHSFLAHIFMQISWKKWLKTIENSPVPVKRRVYQCFFNLLVKLLKEPNIKSQSDRVTLLLSESENLEWNYLEPPIFQHVMDWYVLSCDPRVIFKTNVYNIDIKVLHFLQIVSGYSKPVENLTGDLSIKRLIYVKSFVKLVSVYASRHKSSLSSKENELTSVITEQLNHLEAVVNSQAELNGLLQELLCLLNIESIHQSTLKSFSNWIQNKPGDSIAIRVLLQVLGSISNLESIADLLELTLTSYFQNNVSDNFEPSWSDVGATLNIAANKQKELEQILLNKGHILSLKAILMQRMKRCGDTEGLLHLTIDWLPQIKVNEGNESKIPLLWSGILHLSLDHCTKDECGTGAILYKFAKVLLVMSEERGGSRWGRGLLSAIGISKQAADSMSFRFLCRALAGYVMAQLPEMKGVPQMVRHEANAPARVGQTGGNTECVKVLMSLDFGQGQSKIKECEELALNQIQDAANSMHNANKFLSMLLKQFYIKPYLKNID